jgi:hypothetical protein
MIRKELYFSVNAEAGSVGGGEVQVTGTAFYSESQQFIKSAHVMLLSGLKGVPL